MAEQFTLILSSLFSRFSLISLFIVPFHKVRDLCGIRFRQKRATEISPPIAARVRVQKGVQ